MKYVLEFLVDLFKDAIKMIYLYFGYLVIITLFFLWIFAPAIVLIQLLDSYFLMGVAIFFYPHFLSFLFSEVIKNITNADNIEEEVEKDVFNRTDSVIGLVALFFYCIGYVFLALFQSFYPAARFFQGFSLASDMVVLTGIILLTITTMKIAKKF